MMLEMRILSRLCLVFFFRKYERVCGEYYVIIKHTHKKKKVMRLLEIGKYEVEKEILKSGSRQSKNIWKCVDCVKNNIYSKSSSREVKGSWPDKSKRS